MPTAVRDDRPGRARIATALALILVVMAAFVVRLCDVQVVSAATLNKQAEGRRGVEENIPGVRGNIVTESGMVLADSVDRFDITASPRAALPFTRRGEDGTRREVSVDDALTQLSQATGIGIDSLRASLHDALAKDANSNFAYLVKGVQLDVYQRVKALKIPWVYFDHKTVRTYANAQVAGNLVGFVGGDGKPLAGLEVAGDDCLAGTDGRMTYDRGADGIEIPGSQITQAAARDGGDLVLTINGDVQWHAQQVLASEARRVGSASAQATVIDVKTGKLVAVAEYPTVDPNSPSDTPADDRGSRAFSAPFEPGSIIKPYTAAMAFDQHRATPDDVLTVPDSLKQEGVDFSDDQPHPPAQYTVNGIMAHSSNVGISMVGTRVSPEDRYQYLKNAGLGAKTESGMLGEESGTVHEPKDWDPQTFYAVNFGQGMEVTGPQMASLFQMIGNGGVRKPVQLVAGCRDSRGEVTPLHPLGDDRRVISPEAAQQALRTMEAVAQSGYLAKQVAIPGYRIGMKTGTAQYSDGSGQYVKGKYYLSMVGVAPIDDPRYVVAVTFSPPATMKSSAATAPSWHDIMAYVLRANSVPPSPQPWPQIPVEQGS